LKRTSGLLKILFKNQNYFYYCGRGYSTTGAEWSRSWSRVGARV